MGCLYPQKLKNGMVVGCRRCWQCRTARVDNYLGRALAESRVSDQTIAVTLTYKSDHPHSQFLVYSDFQKMLKRLRRAEYSVRYIVAGEYGERKGRAHWHAILFVMGNERFLDKDGKPVPVRGIAHWDFWPHGHTYFQPPGVGGFRYLLKYLIKDQARESQSSFGLSKKPVLGFSYFLQLGIAYAKSGFVPSTPRYDLQDRTYPLTGRARDAFLRSYAAAYWREHGKDAVILPRWASDVVSNDFVKWRGYFGDFPDPLIQGLDEEFFYAFPPEGFAGPPKREVRSLAFGEVLPSLFPWAALAPDSPYRNLEVLRQQVIEFKQAVSAGVRHPVDTCECASCGSRRQWETLSRRKLPIEPGASYGEWQARKVSETASLDAYRASQALAASSGGSDFARKRLDDAIRNASEDRRRRLASSR